jgi:metallo-beta-lactamase family protein
MSTNQYKLTFCSGAETVTGSDFLLEGPLDTTGRPLVRILVDCGLVQGEKIASEANWEPFAYNPVEIDYLFITHAHIDHIGRIPKLVHDGFKGKIFATPATCALARPMLEDTAGILSHNTDEKLDTIYTPEIVNRSLAGWTGIQYEKPFELVPGITVVMHNAGHILGSAFIEFKIGEKSIVFSGDLGNSPSPILPDTAPLPKVDYLLVESVYGDRLHEDRAVRRDMLKDILLDNYKKAGTLIIPTFSLERSQEVLFEINNMLAAREIPKMPIYLDSPLAIAVTKIYHEFSGDLNAEINSHITKNDDPFSFPGLVETLESEQSKHILKMPDPKVIIAGSGMSSGGRVIHHEHNYLSNPNNTLLLIGYQAVGTFGRRLEDGAKSIIIEHATVAVNASIKKIGGYSGHRDSDGLVAFVATAKDTLKKVFTVMGEPKSTIFLAQRIKNELNLDVTAPAKGDSVILDF